MKSTREFFDQQLDTREWSDKRFQQDLKKSTEEEDYYLSPKDISLDERSQAICNTFANLFAVSKQSDQHAKPETNARIQYFIEEYLNLKPQEQQQVKEFINNPQAKSSIVAPPKKACAK